MKKLKKILKYLLIICLSLFIIDAALLAFFSLYHPPLKKADAIIVLGAAINTPAAYNRSLRGLQLYQQGYASVVVLSGGQDFPGAISEAAYMKQVINSKDTSSLPLLIEDQSHSTYDNLKNTKQLLGDKAGSIIVVSDNFHLARSVLMAYRNGFYPVYWSSPEPESFDFNEMIYYYGREMAAMFDYVPKLITN